jgi:hypothetical protein
MSMERGSGAKANMSGLLSGVAEVALADDLMEGADVIAEFLFGDRQKRRKVYHLVSDAKAGAKPPIFRMGASSAHAARRCCAGSRSRSGPTKRRPRNQAGSRAPATQISAIPQIEAAAPDAAEPPPKFQSETCETSIARPPRRGKRRRAGRQSFGIINAT